MTNVIEVKHLTKRYGSIQAIKDISFTVKNGSFFAFLGTNGAGKSTTIDILCTLLDKTSGTVSIAGHTLGNRKNNDEIRKAIGVVFQKSILDDRLTVYENIWHRGKSYALSKEILQENYNFLSHYLHLEDISNLKYGKLSGGQRRRADIARALIHRPSILFLDEPTTGLDPQTRIFVWDAIKKIQQDQNMTIFLTTHYMEEAAMADEIVIMKKGQIVEQGTPSQLKHHYASDQLKVIFVDQIKGKQLLIENSLNFEQQKDSYIIQLSSTLHALPILSQLEPYLQSFEVIKGSMDDVFIRINEKEHTL